MKKEYLVVGGGIALAVLVGWLAWRRKQSKNYTNPGGDSVENKYPLGANRYPNREGKSRGDRNNNPLNIRYSSANDWKGQIGSDGAFCQFSSRDYGYRAAFKNLFSYIKAGNNTIRKIITRWAPPEDNNNTAGYIENVSSRSGIDKDLQIAVTDKDKLFKIVREMAKIESLLTPTDAELQRAWDLI